MKYKRIDGHFDPEYLNPYSHDMTYVQSDTGKKAIYLNGYVSHIDNVTEEESSLKLKQLRSIQIQKDFVQRLKWYPNMLAIWDNRTCIHRATTDYNETRILYRMLVREE
jgi:alpha-ketoglutarate-dependent taurine dioxygenase